MINEKLQMKVAAEEIGRLERDPSARLIYGDSASRLLHVQSKILEAIWTEDSSVREDFSCFDNFKFFALAEASGRTKILQGRGQKQERILIDIRL